MFPNIRLMIVTVLAAILGIGCGLGLFATFRVNHEPLARLSDGGAPLQLAWEKVTPAPRSSTLSMGYPLAGAAKPTRPQSPPPLRADAEALPAPSVAATPGSDQIAGDDGAATLAPKADSQTDLAVAPPAESYEPRSSPAPAAETAPASDAAASDVLAAKARSAPATASIAQPAPAAGAVGAITPTAEAVPTAQTEKASAPSIAPAAETPSITSATPAIPEAAPAPAAVPPAERASTATADVPPAENAATAPAAETAGSAAAAPAAEPPSTTEAASVAAAEPSAISAPTQTTSAAEATATGSASSAELAPATEAAPATAASQVRPAVPSSEEGTAEPAQNGATAALTTKTPEKPAPAANPADEDHKAAAKEGNKRAVKREAKVARPAPPPPAHRPIIKLTRSRTTRTMVAAPAGESFSQPAYQWTDTTPQTPQTVRRFVIKRRILLRKTAPQSSRQSSANDQGPAANTGEW